MPAARRPSVHPIRVHGHRRPALDGPQAKPFGVSTATPRPLPAWPFTLTILPYPLWWAAGIGEYAVVVMAVPMVFILAHRGGVRAPRGFGVYLFFLLWIALSASQVDTLGPLTGFVYRYGLYVAVGVFFVYLYNARARTDRAPDLWHLHGDAALDDDRGDRGTVLPTLGLPRPPLAYVLPKNILAQAAVRRPRHPPPDPAQP